MEEAHKEELIKEFFQLKKRIKEIKKQISYYELNKEKINRYCHDYYIRNNKKIKEYNSKRYYEDLEKSREYNRKAHLKRRKNAPTKSETKNLS